MACASCPRGALFTDANTLLHPPSDSVTAPEAPSYAARSGKPAVVESFGLVGFGYHARDEYIKLDSIVPRLYLMTRILQDIGRN